MLGLFFAYCNNIASSQEMQIPEGANIDCPFQRTGMGTLKCRAADLGGSSSTDEVYEETCYECLPGKIYREVGCDQFTPKVVIYESRSLGIARPYLSFRVENIFCKKRMRSTTYEYCKSCSLVNAPTTQRIFKEAVEFFEASGFNNSKEFIEEARKKLTGDNLDFDGSITASVSSLESTLKTILDKKGTGYPKKEQLTGLWNVAKKEIHLGEEVASTHLRQVIGSLSGSISGLAGLRNDFSDAHGKGLVSPELYESYAELALNLSASVSTFLIRRFKEDQQSN